MSKQQQPGTAAAGATATGAQTAESAEELRRAQAAAEEERLRKEQLEARLRENERLVSEMTMSYEEKLKRSDAMNAERERALAVRAVSRARARGTSLSVRRRTWVCRWTSWAALRARSTRS